VGKVLKNLYSSVVTVLFFMATLFLLAVTSYNTCYTIASREEYNFFVRDSVILNLLVMALSVVLMVISLKNSKIKELTDKLKNPEIFSKVRFVILIIISAMSVIWVLATRYSPDFDQLYIQDAVYGLWWKDNSAFVPGGYVDFCWNQIGLVVIYYILSFVFGNYNFVALELINALAIPFIYDELSKLSVHFGLGNKGRTLILASGILFLPLVIYGSFIYGTVLGLYFSILSIRLMADYLNGENRKWRVVFSVIAIGLATAIKSNYMIFAIGLGIYVLIKCVDIKKYKKLIIVPAIIISYILFSVTPRLFLVQKTGEKLESNVPSVVWLVMGLQESMANAPGIYTGYSEETYKEAGFDTDVQKQIATNDFNSKAQEIISDPMYAMDFLLRKQAHQWSDPAYKSFWNLQSLYHNSNIAPWAKLVLRADVSNLLIIPLNFLQTVMVFGSLLYVILCRKEKGYIESLVLLTIFIGGFMFHTFWEAKSQYTMPYAVLLFPIAIMGLIKASKLIYKRLNQPKAKENVSKKISQKTYSFSMGIFLGLVSMVMFLVFVVAIFSGIWSGISKNTDEYKAYIKTGYKEMNTVELNGTYSIISEYDKTPLYGMEKLNIVYRNGKARIYVETDRRYYLAAKEINGEDMSNVTFIFSEFADDSTQEFDIIEEDGIYFIIYEEGYALTRGKDGSDFFMNNIKHPQQRWIISE